MSELGASTSSQISFLNRSRELKEKRPCHGGKANEKSRPGWARGRGGKEPTDMAEEIPVRDGGRVPKVSWTMSLPSVSRIQHLLSPTCSIFLSVCKQNLHWLELQIQASLTFCQLLVTKRAVHRHFLDYQVGASEGQDWRRWGRVSSECPGFNSGFQNPGGHMLSH